MRFHLAKSSRNAKTGPIPVSTSSATTCPDSCPFKRNGCYADGGPLATHWRAVTEGKRGTAWPEFIAAVEALPKGQLWRHNQAGDLPGDGDKIDTLALVQLVDANARGRKRGFTFTHKPMNVTGNASSVAHANASGFTVNLSANNPAHADQLAALGVGPVVVVLPADQTRARKTPAGRPIAVCPAVLSDDVSCATCGLCALPNRKAIVGFPAHGTSKRKASVIAQGEC